MKRLLPLFLTLALLSAAAGFTSDPQAQRQATAHEIAELARSLGVAEDDPIIMRAKELWWGDDLQILANVIYHEAPYCTDRHQQLVAQVVINRVRDTRFPDSVKAVVEQPGQYHPAYASDFPAEPDEEFARCLLNARAALEGQVDCPADVIYQSEFRDLGDGIYEQITVDTGYFHSTTYFCFG